MSGTCGKLILCGEHFVLFGTPAIALPWRGGRLSLRPLRPDDPPADPAWDARLRTAWNVARAAAGLPAVPGCPFAVDSTIPPGAGLGSSAALSVSLVREAFLEAGTGVGDERLIRVATQVEGVFHGRSSGLDPAVVVLERPALREAGSRVRPLPWHLPERELVLALAPGSRRSAEAIERTHAFAAARPDRFRALRTEATRLVREVAVLIQGAGASGGAPRVGALLTRNHAMLAELGVSSPDLDRLVVGALSAGALGAKLSGAGLGGVVLALPPPGGAAVVAEALAREGAAEVLRWEWAAGGEGSP